MAARNAKRSISTNLEKKRGLWTIYPLKGSSHVPTLLGLQQNLDSTKTKSGGISRTAGWLTNQGIDKMFRYGGIFSIYFQESITANRLLILCTICTITSHRERNNEEYRSLFRGLRRTVVRYTEVLLYMDFTLTVPTCNPTRPYREGEDRRENLGTKPGSQTLFVGGSFRSVKFSEIRHRSIPPHARENLWYPAEYPATQGILRWRQ